MQAGRDGKRETWLPVLIGRLRLVSGEQCENPSRTSLLSGPKPRGVVSIHAALLEMVMTCHVSFTTMQSA